jgi:hypothetical protein
MQSTETRRKFLCLPVSLADSYEDGKTATDDDYIGGVSSRS